MTRWLIVAPVLCALTVPSAAWAQQPTAPPASQPTEAPAAVEAPAEPATEPETATLEAAPAEPAPATVGAPPPPPPVLTTTPTPPPPAPTGPHLDPRAEPLLAAGLGGFAALYLLTAYAGAASIDKARDISRRDSIDDNGQMTRNRGRALLVPVAGPFIAMRFTNSARRKYWQAINGSLQAGTLVMGIIGARMYGKHRRAKRKAQLTASASPEGAQLGMAMRF